MDAGADVGSGVGQTEAFARSRDNLGLVTGPLSAAVAGLPRADRIEPADDVP